jgi:hypothetical protein
VIIFQYPLTVLEIYERTPFGPVRPAYQPDVVLSQSKPGISNQPAVLFSQNKSATSQANMLQARKLANPREL